MHMYNDQLYTCGSLGIMEPGVVFLLLLSKIASKRDEYSCWSNIIASSLSFMLRNVVKLIDAYVLS